MFKGKNLYLDPVSPYGASFHMHPDRQTAKQTVSTIYKILVSENIAVV